MDRSVNSSYLDAYLNIVLFGHDAPAGRIEEWVEPHCDGMSREQRLRALGAVWNTVQVRRYRVTIPGVHLGWVDLDLGSSYHVGTLEAGWRNIPNLS